MWCIQLFIHKYNMKVHLKLWPIFILNFIFIGSSLAELLSITVGVTSVGVLIGSYLTYCLYSECCSVKYIPMNTRKLRSDLESKLFGQPLAMEIVPIIEGHRSAIVKATSGSHPMKALALSFHGWPGTGKNFVTNMIAESLYEKGLKSSYFKLYIGRHDFPDSRNVLDYQVKLRNEIKAMVSKCSMSLIVFDEVNDIPPGVLDVLKPMLDYHEMVDGVDYRQTIFIFLSNVNGNEIVQRLSELNTPRDRLKLSNFEELLKSASFSSNGKELYGGFSKSQTLSSHLIDHFIPFLPLEEKHVIKCVNAEFRQHGIFTPSRSMINDVMDVVTYGPKHDPIYSNVGCKRIKNQVTYIIEKTRRNKT